MCPSCCPWAASRPATMPSLHLEPEFRRRESHDLLHEVMAEQQI
jgi:hypothetical protein